MADPTFCAFADDIDRSATLLEKLVLPVFSPCVASRREIVAEFDALMAMNQNDQSTPLWMRDESTADQASLDWHKDLRWLRFLPLDNFHSSMSLALTGSELAMQQRDATLVAIGLELYRRDRGAYPISLDDLVPRFMPAVPPDRFDGNPVRYRLVNGKPVIYSVGSDRMDDGGNRPKAMDACLSGYWASHWVPAGKIAEALKNKIIRRGDWVLWPPVD